ncbi:glycosyltransferase [Blautia obeum]|uniref:Glycosyl transferase family 2 n=1 Tax=Blautia obeum TaxID=40520 RepID=A0A367FUC1_9FIRM|nr:glycosyltransferase [Blautia obeum]RCH41563.1 glycosyl transferase family 2 [Blautia obeum]
MVKVAVLLSTYNGEKFLREQINSILNQVGNFKLDLYVRDDGSDDGTINILKEYENENKLKWYTGINLKPAKSFIDLLSKCGEYDYYAFADQDDYWHQDKIQRGIHKLCQQEGPALYCSNAVLVGKDLKSLGRNVYKTQPRTDFETIICAGGLLGCTMIFNDELARIIKASKNHGKMVLHDFYIAAVCVSIGGNIIYDSDATMKYRQHGENVVGVSHGLLGTVIGRVRDIYTKESIGIADQARSILFDYKENIEVNNQKWLEQVAHYNDNNKNRLKLAFSVRTKYININMSLKLRISILFGNR